MLHPTRWFETEVWWPVEGGLPWQAVQAVMLAFQAGVCRVPPELVPVLFFTAWHHVEAQLAATVPLRAVNVPTCMLAVAAPVNPTSFVPFACVVV